MAPTYTSPGPRSIPAILALYVKVGACLVAVGADVRRIVVAGKLGDGHVLVDALLGADQLVLLASLLELVALVVAAVLGLRWLAVVRANAPVLEAGRLWGGLGDDGLRRLLRTWAVALVVAAVAVVASRVLLGAAATVADRQRIDLLRAVATALSGVAAGLTIAVVSKLTARQEALAARVGPPRPPSRRTADVSASGLRVVSEEQARRGA